MSYRHHLQKKKLNNNSIESYQRDLKIFLEWLDYEYIMADVINYETITKFISYCRNKGNKERTIRHKLLAIKYWLDYRNVKPNPCKGWLIKSRGKPLPSPLLTEIEINKIYNAYPSEETHEIRSKVVIGLMCYQALDGGEIQALTIDNVYLDMGIILIRKKARSAARSIRLSDVQKEVLTKYINTTRNEILNGRKSDKLIVHYGTSNHIKNILRALYERLQKKHERFVSIRQIRASVISNWLKTHNLREVQYMAGHKYVSSTERYLESRIEELQQQLDQLHPMK